MVFSLDATFLFFWCIQSFLFDLGLPRPLGGSGCLAARRSARPCGAKAPWSAAFGGPAAHPSADGPMGLFCAA